ncbi:hypothetical protein FO519_002786 [Halicephalobus sp. NKZ332]|nr:hypothetical protein FO519_002786 [Halicephalobus sp. NKZ332]
MYCISELNARQHRRSPMSREGGDSPSNSEYSISEIAASAFKNKEDAKKIAQFIEEKEKDLELAATIGKSLLDQNKELRERNEFLEESLNFSNDTITQLKHQLQQRSSLLHAVCDLEEDLYEEQQIQRESKAVENLQNKVKQLEKENDSLKVEANSLKEFVCELELQSQEKIDEYLKQLENANLRIAKLHNQITEKNIECNAQATEIQKLVKDIHQRKMNESSLQTTTIGLHQQLTEAVSAHGQLKEEILNLQEVYTDVRAKLHEAEEELGRYRLKAPPHRSGSTDSLYDSLASEMEANDSGFFGTPMISARTDSRQSSTDFYSPGSNLQEEMEKMKKVEPIDENCSFEVPSKVLIESVRRNNRRLREKSPSLAEELLPAMVKEAQEAQNQVKSDENQLQITQNQIENDQNQVTNDLGQLQRVSNQVKEHQKQVRHTPKQLESIEELNTPVENVSIENSLLKIREETPKVNERRNATRSETSESDPEDPELRFIEEECLPSTSSNVGQIQKTFRDSSCSPIPLIGWQIVEKSSLSKSPRSISPESIVSPKTQSLSSKNRLFDPEVQHSDSEDQNSDSEETPRVYETTNLIKSGSNDSLFQYNGPKLGEPGKPGTRDLEYSLRKLNLKKQIERDYQRFREARGLPPVRGFFVSPPEVKATNLCGPLSSQLEYLSTSQEDTKPKLSLVSRPFPTPKTLVFGKSNWQRKNLGLGSAILDQSNDGVFQRNVLQSPETPTTSKSMESTPSHNGLRTKHGSSFLQALGLNMLIDDGAPGSPTKSVFRSPFLIGPFKADREYSPPFGGSPSGIEGTSLEGSLHLGGTPSVGGNLPSGSSLV